MDGDVDMQDVIDSNDTKFSLPGAPTEAELNEK